MSSKNSQLTAASLVLTAAFGHLGDVIGRGRSDGCGALAERVVAPQIAVESPGSGPLLRTAEVKVERQATDG
ncbi:hypothetical protein [Streptomyces caeruleatus]|uniref:hypothetical protein n=1 Tax=Streptomyces caeruleatus TaxID=661399 RepID=UPI000A993D70|nr:hypothetical protein [Streptomyces caeruleatus]